MPTAVFRARLERAIIVSAVTALLSACSDKSTAPRSLRPSTANADITAQSMVTVTNTADDGAGSLRDAIANAPDGSTIQFDPSIAGQTILLQTSFLAVDKSLTIEGPNQGMTVDGNGLEHVFLMSQAGTTITLRNLTITHGNSVTTEGGGIEAQNVDLTLDHVLVLYNSAGIGGGVALPNGSLTLINSTVYGNLASLNGGGISANNGSVTLRHSTVVQNTAATGGGIDWLNKSNGPFTATLENTIVANNSATTGPNCHTGLSRVPTLVGVNLFDDASCGEASANALVADPQLGVLADNGGPTRTVALLGNSPAIDAAVNCSVTTDQRYVSRPQGLACDIGAYEFTDFVTGQMSIDGGGLVNLETGAAVISGTVTCPTLVALTLHVSLTQPQKLRKVPTTAGTEGDVPVTCSGISTWAIALTPRSGTFENGVAAAVAKATQPKYFLASASSDVFMKWLHK